MGSAMNLSGMQAMAKGKQGSNELHRVYMLNSVMEILVLVVFAWPMDMMVIDMGCGMTHTMPAPGQLYFELA